MRSAQARTARQAFDEWTAADDATKERLLRRLGLAEYVDGVEPVLLGDFAYLRYKGEDIGARLWIARNGLALDWDDEEGPL